MTILNWERARRQRREPEQRMQEAPPTSIAYLNVSYRDRIEAKRLGARWSSTEGLWYCMGNSARVSALIARFGLARRVEAA